MAKEYWFHYVWYRFPRLSMIHSQKASLWQLIKQCNCHISTSSKMNSFKIDTNCWDTRYFGHCAILVRHSREALSSCVDTHKTFVSKGQTQSNAGSGQVASENNMTMKSRDSPFMRLPIQRITNANITCIFLLLMFLFVISNTYLLVDLISSAANVFYADIRNILKRRYLSNFSLILTFNVRGPSCLGLTRSISWLLIPWLLTSPGHQQPWYWLCRIGMFLSYLRKDFNYLHRINVEKWDKKWIYVYVPSEKFST